jgi:hypothetical protein
MPLYPGSQDQFEGELPPSPHHHTHTVPYKGACCREQQAHGNQQDPNHAKSRAAACAVLTFTEGRAQHKH